MGLEALAISETHDLPIRHVGPVHNGKVRSVYWLGTDDSARVCDELGIDGAPLGVMVTSDRISAFECLWRGEGGLRGVPGKGASLNAISAYWFERFVREGLAGHHIATTPHPLVWIVRQASPVLVEAIGRQYITGSMWREYSGGGREFCGIGLPDGLAKDQRLPELLITPTTKGTLRGIPGVPEKDDVNVTREQLVANYREFGFRSPDDVALYERLLGEGFSLISRKLARRGMIFVDTKFEFGYIDGALAYMDEVGTPDSSRYWNAALYEQGVTREDSKERFREMLLAGVPDRDVLLNKGRMAEREALAHGYRVPAEQMMEVSALYTGLAEQITERRLPEISDPRQEILDSLSPFGLVE